MSDAPVVIERVSHWYGDGALRRQILFDVSAVVRPGEIVILSGPSGSGKTTLLTLVGALRSTQAGSLRVLDHELRDASEAVLTRVRRRIGYVFQSHNLLDALTAAENVELGMELHPQWSADARARRAADLLANVGLEGLGARHPRELSGGQRQRVAIARALAGDPRILLADEPTASLDQKTGRAIVSLIEQLARKHAVTVVLVTHDTRILDVADRVLSLEDGRLTSFMSAVTSDTRHLWSVLARDIRQGELVRRVREIAPERFVELLGQVTEETRDLVEMVDLAQNRTFDSMLAQVLQAFAQKVGELLRAQRTRFYFVDMDRAELFSVLPGGAGDACEVRVPVGRGVAGRVAREGTHANLSDASADPDFASDVDLGGRGERLLAMPLCGSNATVYAVVELERESEASAFSGADEKRLRELSESLSAVLEAWFRMSCRCRAGRELGSVADCCVPGAGGACS